jgi:hypothetical protein
MSETQRPVDGKGAALRRFPAKARLIEELTERSEDFRDMCEELAEAELALLAAKDAPPGVRAERIAEWTGWIDRLSEEIEAALERVNVLALGRTNRPGKRP